MPLDVVHIGDATLYHGDCLEILPTLERVDAMVTDPPYGIDWIPRINHREQIWIDDKQFDPAPFMDFAEKHLFWGANYYAHLLPPTKDWYIWCKRPVANFEGDRKTFAPFEMAWSDFGTGGRVKQHIWDGGKRQGDQSNRLFCHPAQKPLEVMEWCVADTGQSICDPFMGSGTTGMACANLGRKFIGIEIEERYFKIACERIDAAYAQGRLFA